MQFFKLLITYGDFLRFFSLISCINLRDISVKLNKDDEDHEGSKLECRCERVLETPLCAFILPDFTELENDFRAFLEKDLIETATLKRLENSGISRIIWYYELIGLLIAISDCLSLYPVIKVFLTDIPVVGYRTFELVALEWQWPKIMAAKYYRRWKLFVACCFIGHVWET